MWNVSGMLVYRKIVLWILLALCFPADFPRDIKLYLFTLSLAPSSNREKVLSYINHISLLATVSKGSLCWSQLCIKRDALLTALPDIGAYKRDVSEAYSKECAAVCGKGHAPGSIKTARVTLHFDVLLLEVRQRHREWKTGFKLSEWKQETGNEMSSNHGSSFPNP